MFLFTAAPIFANDTTDPIIARIENDDSIVLPVVYVSTDELITQLELLDSNYGVVQIRSNSSSKNVTVFLEGSYQEVVGVGYSIVIANSNGDR